MDACADAGRNPQTKVCGNMKTVALLLDERNNAYQQILVRDARAAARELKIRLLEPEFAAGAPWDQFEALNAHLRSPQPPDGIIALVVGPGTAGPFERVAKAGLSIVLLNRIPVWLQDVRDRYPQTLIGAVTPRHES